MVVGFVLFLVFEGSGEDLGPARAALSRVFTAAVQHDAATGEKLLSPPQLLSDDNPDLVRTWSTLSPSQREDATKRAWRVVAQRVCDKDELGLKDSSAIDRVLARAKVTWASEVSTAHFLWTWNGLNWSAMMVKQEDGTWKLVALDRGAPS